MTCALQQLPDYIRHDFVGDPADKERPIHRQCQQNNKECEHWQSGRCFQRNAFRIRRVHCNLTTFNKRMMIIGLGVNVHVAGLFQRQKSYACIFGKSTSPADDCSDSIVSNFHDEALTGNLGWRTLFRPAPARCECAEPGVSLRGGIHADLMPFAACRVGPAVAAGPGPPGNARAAPARRAPGQAAARVDPNGPRGARVSPRRAGYPPAESSAATRPRPAGSPAGTSGRFRPRPPGPVTGSVAPPRCR